MRPRCFADVKIPISEQTAKYELKLIAMRRALQSGAVDRIVLDVATRTQKALAASTGLKTSITGKSVRNGWQVSKFPSTDKSAVGYFIHNRNDDVVRYLEYGTQAHGPRVKKALFIPLTSRAVNATQGSPVYTRRTFTQRTFTPTGPLRGSKNQIRGLKISVPVIIRPQVSARGKKSNTVLKYGVDYVLAKRVRGITARHFVANQDKLAQLLLTHELTNIMTRVANAN